MLSWGIGGVFRRFSIKECDKIKVSKAKNYCRLPSAPLPEKQKAEKSQI